MKLLKPAFSQFFFFTYAALDIADEDIKLKALLASNFGRLKNSPMKQAKVIAEYERLAGVTRGGVRAKGQIDPLTQTDIATSLGIDINTLKRLKRLQHLTPELQALVDSGELNYTTAVSLWAKLPKEDQDMLYNELGNGWWRYGTLKCNDYIY